MNFSISTLLVYLGIFKLLMGLFSIYFLLSFHMYTTHISAILYKTHFAWIFTSCILFILSHYMENMVMDVF